MIKVYLGNQNMKHQKILSALLVSGLLFGCSDNKSDLKPVVQEKAQKSETSPEIKEKNSLLAE